MKNLNGRNIGKKGGRQLFQEDAAMMSMKKAIEVDWLDYPNQNTKPKWICQKHCIPCDCKECFWFEKRVTSGVAHRGAAGVGYRPGPCDNIHESIRKEAQICKQCARKR